MTQAAVQLPPARRAISPSALMLPAIIGLELLIFSLLGTNFFTLTNVWAVLRLNVELGLIALALTPVIVTGGIDLSVGSIMGLTAVCFGYLAKVVGVPWPVAAAAGIGVGVVGGWLNGFFVSTLRIPPLIVTLGTLSLFRGMAEGITKGSANYTDFSNGFLSIGQGKLGPLPVQAIALILAAVAFYLLLHRSTVGRSLSAIGYAPEGARYAGIAVENQLRRVYLLSGVCAAIAALIYVARVGQAKADAGTGYELSAITAVVLGGTSIFGGRGSVGGTLLGLLALALLENGLRLADLPPEVAGIFRGGLLLVAIGADLSRSKSNGKVGAAAVASGANSEEEFEMKNGQIAALCGTILLAALLIVASNFALVKQIKEQVQPQRVELSMQMPPGLPGATPGVNGVASAMAGVVTTGVPRQPRQQGKGLVIAMMPKSKGDAYFVACRKGADEAAKELGVTLLYDGPTDNDPAKQNDIVDTWVTRGVDAIAVSVLNRDGISTALRAAMANGIKVVTFDADAQPDARQLFVNQATPQGIGTVLMDNAAAALGNKGKFAIITAGLTDANQNEWIVWIKKRLAEKYPEIELVTIRPSDGNGPKAFEETKTVLNANPDVKLIMAIAAPAVPSAAEAVKQSGRTDVHVVGLGLPNDNKPYVKSGITTAVVLWNTMDLGYLTVQASVAVVNGELKAGDKSFKAGRMGEINLQADNVMLGTPFTFNKDNIDGFDF